MGGLLGLELRGAIHMPRNLRLKRVLDLIVAIPAHPSRLPMIAVLALAVKAVDNGPAFYAQAADRPERQCLQGLQAAQHVCGRRGAARGASGGRQRGRTEWERFFKLSSDPRILPRIGQLIRRTSLDELPQLLTSCAAR